MVIVKSLYTIYTLGIGEYYYHEHKLKHFKLITLFQAHQADHNKQLIPLITILCYLLSLILRFTGTIFFLFVNPRSIFFLIGPRPCHQMALSLNLMMPNINMGGSMLLLSSHGKLYHLDFSCFIHYGSKFSSMTNLTLFCFYLTPQYYKISNPKHNHLYIYYLRNLGNSLQHLLS